MQCRITTENPENNFIPDYGRITAYRGAFGFGIRVDGGTAYSGAVVTRFYDPLLEKITAWAPTPQEVIARMDRALREYRIRGVATNLAFLETLIEHPKFRANDYTTRFIDDTPELFHLAKRRDRATKLLTYVADVTVNGHPDVKGRARPRADARSPEPPRLAAHPAPGEGTKALLDRLGAAGFAKWMREQTRVLVTDTTMRDAHQSLLATRMRTFDIVAAAEPYALALPQLFSLECWGGATFDVAMRFLTEDPVGPAAHRSASACPACCCRCCCAARTASATPTIPDNVVRHFVRQSAEAGMDLFRIFDCLNWVENMRVAIDAVVESGKLAEGAICYTGDILDPDRAKYSLSYYVGLAKELEAAGCHILAVKDMAGLLKPSAAGVLIKALKAEIGLPIHLHTHDTSGTAAATRAGGGRCRRRCGRRGHGRHVGPDLAALPGLDRRGAAPHAARHRARPRGDPPAQLLLGGGAGASMRRSRATCAPGRRRSTCTRCRAASSPISRSRRARWAWRRAGTRSPAPTAPPTTCSATSSR